MSYIGSAPSRNVPAYKQVYEFTATSGQTTFSVPYTVGFVEVYRNGVKLGAPNFTATNGTSVVLASGANTGDFIQIVSEFINPVLNAIPNTAGAVTTSNILDNSIITSKILDGAITTAKIAEGAVVTADLSNNAVTTDKVANAAITASKIDTPYLMVVGSGYTVPDGVSNIVYDQLVEARNMSHNSGINMVFTVAGRYKITTGWRFGSGGDVWTGVRLANSSGTVIAKGFGTGQANGADPGPCEISFIANITQAMLNTNMRMQFFRAGSSMGIGNPNTDAGYAIVTTVNYVGI